MHVVQPSLRLATILLITGLALVVRRRRLAARQRALNMHQAAAEPKPTPPVGGWHRQMPSMPSIPFAEGRSNAVLAEARVLNLTPPSKIGSGICFFDHMLDQFTSHAQLGVTLRCGVLQDSPQPRVEKDCFAPLKDYATGLSSRSHDKDIFVACGTALGLALKRVVNEVAGEAAAAAPPSSAAQGSAVFCSPLDESFTEASIELLPPDERAGQCETRLEPYGSFGGEKGSGRKWVGRYRTDLTPAFWSALAIGLGCNLSIVKVRGGNAHHQLESAFKAFARAFRAASTTWQTEAHTVARRRARRQFRRVRRPLCRAAPRFHGRPRRPPSMCSWTWTLLG